MASKREQVIVAVQALIEQALPLAKFRRNETKQETIPADGYVVLNDGDPGDPETTLNPVTYIYEHAIGVIVAAKKKGLDGAESRLDTMLSAIGAAIAADRTLGGLCDYLMAEAPATETVSAAGAESARIAEFNIVTVYGTTDPLN